MRHCRQRGTSTSHRWCCAGAETATINGAPAKVLAPEDLLLHLCMHASLHHGFAINVLHVCDIPAVVDHYRDRIDWNVLWSRAGAWGAERSVLVMFGLAERLLGWQCPAEAAHDLEELPPASFEVLALAERLVFDEGTDSMLSSNLARLWGDAGVTTKMRTVLARTFPSPAKLAFMHGVPAKSWKLPLLYPLRVGQLLARYARPMMRAVRGEADSRAALDVAQERNKMVEWLGG